MEGIDVSVYQGNIDWSKVRGIDFAYIKASQGVKFYDTKCQQNAISLSKTNIKFGYYHFATLNSIDVFSDARNEAFDFIHQLSILPKSSLCNALDIELNDSVKLNPQQVENWIHTFINTMTSVGYKTILYSYKPFLDANLPPNHTLGQYPLWIAQYTHNSLPTLPHGFTQYHLWQFTDKGIIDGIKGNVDLNHARVLV